MMEHVLVFAIIQAFIATMGFSLLRPSIAWRLRFELTVPAVVVTGFGSLFLLGRTLGSLSSGIVAERFHCFTAWIQPLGLFITSLVVFMYASSNSWLGILVLGFIQGLIAGHMWPLLQSLVSQSVEPSRRAQALTLYFSLAGLGLMIGYLLYSVVGHDPVRAILYSAMLYTTSAAISLVAYSTTYRNVCKRRQEAMRRNSHYVSVSRKSILLVAIISTAYGLCLGLRAEYSYLVLWEVGGVGVSEIGILYAVSELLSTLIGLLLARLSVKMAEEKLVLAVSLLTFIAPIFSMIVKPLIPITVALYVATITSLLGLVRSYSVKLIGHEKSHIALGVSNAATGLGSGVASMISGVVYQAIVGVKPELTLLTYSATTLSLMTMLLATTRLSKKID